MDLNEFIDKALITESTVNTINVNRDFLANTVGTLIAAGNVLDLIKKNAFYDRPFDQQKLQHNLEQLQKYSSSLCNTTQDDIDDKQQLDNINQRVFHSIVGVTTESIELLEALDLNSETLDTVNILEEFGDIDWYKSLGIDELNGDWEQILSTIIDKLEARYNGSFSSEKANSRNLEQERQILGQMGSDSQSSKGC